MTGDIALLFLRVGFGSLMLFGHGLGKLTNFNVLVDSFRDPIGLGPAVSLCLAIFAEVFCSSAIILGIMTRLAAIPLLITMLVAAGIVHADDPWNKKEMALLYAVAFICMIIAGGGRFALDRAQNR